MRRVFQNTTPTRLASYKGRSIDFALAKGFQVESSCNRLQAAIWGEGQVSKSNRKHPFSWSISAAALAASLCMAQPAHAQLTTATVRGHVTTTAAPAGSVVTAVNVDTKATIQAPVGPDGSYSLTGLRPGTYDIGVSAGEGAAAGTQRVIIGVGETATLDLDATTPAAPPPEAATTQGGAIVVTGRRLVETKTSEVATHVSRDQIENLPKTNRNFSTSRSSRRACSLIQSEFRQTFSGGGVGGDRTARLSVGRRSTCSSTASA